MAYSLTDALGSLRSSMIYGRRHRTLEALEMGIHPSLRNLPFSPVENVLLYDGDLALIADTDYDVDLVSGLVQFDDSGSGYEAETIYGTYDVVQFSEAQLLDIVATGFGELVARGAFPWYLVTDMTGTYVSSHPTLIVDPVMKNGLTFSASRIQTGVFLTANLYTLKLMEWIYGSGMYYMYRENRGAGVLIDKSKLNDALAKVVQYLSLRLDAALIPAGVEFGKQRGAFITGPNTRDYASNYAWWPRAEGMVLF